jgi:hypothetical protein
LPARLVLFAFPNQEVKSMPQSIPLTRGQYATVDDADYPALTRFRWFYTSTHS